MSSIERNELIQNSLSTEPVPFPIPGATPGGITAKLLNVDASKGLVTTVIIIAPGAEIPAHYHENGSEAHFVLEGDFVENGVTYGPGTFLTHPAKAIHGPHSSVNGCQVLTLQASYVDPANPDFHIAE